jgi:hypothetical protein
MNFKIPIYLGDNGQSGPDIKEIRYLFYMNFFNKKSIFSYADI